MKIRMKLASIILLLSIVLTSCLSKNKNSSEQNIEVSKTIGGESENEDDLKEKPIGVPYEIGITPDDYNMDYDTSRILSLEDKKSKFYPKNGVKGIYFSTGTINDPEVYNRIVSLVEDTNLNAVVIDVKDDWGHVTVDFKTDNRDIQFANTKILNAKTLIDDLHSRGIYVIGRITSFKDTTICKLHPDWAFKRQDGSLWSNSRGETFINPFLKEVQDYNIEIARLAAKAGFDEIQFDYVRFAEGFETFSDQLIYSEGDYEKEPISEGDKRVKAITSFVRRARETVQKYKIPISVDVFGYALQAGRADGIGQDFSEISNESDIMCSMIYPSHWGPMSFDLEKPDLEPYELVKRYLREEQDTFAKLDHKPLSRPWIQDFTASWIGDGNWMTYDKDAVQAQIDAIYESGQNEYLIWNATNTYTEGVDY